jgi:hypothetical protein
MGAGTSWALWASASPREAEPLRALATASSQKGSYDSLASLADQHEQRSHGSHRDQHGQRQRAQEERGKYQPGERQRVHGRNARAARAHAQEGGVAIQAGDVAPP